MSIRSQKQSYKFYFMLLALPALMALGLHKFYVSVTHMQYDVEEGAFQITTRLFMDDMEEMLLERYDLKAALGTAEEDPRAAPLIENYLTAKFRVKINGQEQELVYLGKEYKDDLVVCYLELTGIVEAELRSMEVESSVLTDIFEEQQNVVHIKKGGQKKSFILVRGNNKGMLNF